MWFLTAKLANFDPDTWVVRFGVENSLPGR
jgi:hypothetical protein